VGIATTRLLAGAHYTAETLVVILGDAVLPHQNPQEWPHNVRAYLEGEVILAHGIIYNSACSPIWTSTSDAARYSEGSQAR
jgi:dTDP-glucose pyrophosphorylase